MPNPIKYSTGSETDALKKGNFYIGTGSVGKGPSDVTGYYQGPSPVSGGYVIYMNKDGAPGNLSYHSAANDAQLISFTNSLAGQSYTTVQQCFDYYYGQTDKVLVNQDYPADYPYIVMDGLVLNLDAGITQSYPGSGTVWTDVNGLGPRNNGTLTNGPTFNSDNGGSIVFDGSNDLCTTTVNIESATSSNLQTYCSWVHGVGGSFFGSGADSTGKFHLILNYQSSTSIRFAQSFYGGGDVFDQTNIVTVSPNSTWNHACIVKTAISTYDVYFNGIKVISNATKNANLPAPFNLGRWWNNNFVVSRISNVQIYNRALSAEEVLQNYNAQKGRFGL